METHQVPHETDKDEISGTTRGFPDGHSRIVILKIKIIECMEPPAGEEPLVRAG
jgi:hypothetical protein